MIIESPARAGMPPAQLLVRPDGTDPRAGSEHDGSPGFVRYLLVSGSRRAPGEPWTLMFDDDDGGRASPPGRR